MRYLALAADYLEPSIRDERAGTSDVSQLAFSAALVDRITSWNAEYQQVIPLDMDARRTAAQLIDELDKAGLALAEEIAAELEEPVKVRYYSEGWLRYLT